jgi:hypothetical protein
MSTKVVLLINFRFFEKPDFFPDLLSQLHLFPDMGKGKHYEGNIHHVCINRTNMIRCMLQYVN